MIWGENPLFLETLTRYHPVHLKETVRGSQEPSIDCFDRQDLLGGYLFPPWEEEHHLQNKGLWIIILVSHQET